MPNRREFFKEMAGATAGVVFTGCSLLNAQQSAKSGGAPKRRQVMVGGRRVKTIDVHAHVVVPEATALMGRKTEADNAGDRGRGNGRGALRAHGRVGYRHASP